VWRQERHKQEKRLAAGVGFDDANGLVADECGRIAILLQDLAVALPVDEPAELLGEVVHLADEVAVEVVEPAALWPVCLVRMSQMPLASHGGTIPGFLEGLRQRALLGGQPVCLAGRDDHGLQAIAHGVASGHQRRPSRRAGWQAIEGLH